MMQVAIQNNFQGESTLQKAIYEGTIMATFLRDAARASNEKCDEQMQGSLTHRANECKVRESLLFADVLRQTGLYDKYEDLLDDMLSHIVTIEDMIYNSTDIDNHIDDEDILPIWKKAEEMTMDPLDFSE